MTTYALPGASRRRTARARVAQPAPRPRRAGKRSAVRLTRRGRVAVVLLISLVVLAAFSLGRVSLYAADGGRARAPRRHAVVQPGDTLWSIARRVAPGTDPRATVEQL